MILIYYHKGIYLFNRLV